MINAPVFGGPLRLSVPASNPDDRLLDMLGIGDVTPGRMLASRGRDAAAGPAAGADIRVWHAARLHVHADDPLEVTLDGEIAGTLPGIFEVAGEALRVITPLGFEDIED